jgi:hypothetical protein
MERGLITEIRALSRVKGKQSTWISTLSDEQILAIFHRLRNGESAKSIARYIQQAWGVNPTSSVHALSQGILKFQKRSSHLLTLSASPPQKATKDADSLTLDFDPGDTLESLDYIARLQRDRIIGTIEREKVSGVKHAYLNRDLQALAALQKVILKQKAFELLHDDPLTQRKWARFEQDVQKKFDAFMKITPEDDRLKLATALINFMEEAEKRAVTLVIDSDGNYTLPKD